ncbi:MAG: glycosyltransferase family 2 protein [Chloroflexi bacterium]|nr:glycosyltransferase family 2 protein [Chloroflexota bacterium]
MSKPLVTVIIPTYNRADLLCEAVQSVLDQTYQDFAILISDNASSDNTAEAVACFGDPRIHYHRRPANVGMKENFRLAIAQAETEFVATLPDDDLYLPEHLQSGLDALASHPQAIYYACPARFFGDDTAGALRPRGISDTTTPLIYCPPEQAVNFLGIDTPGPLHGVYRRAAFHERIFWGPSDFPPFDMLVLIQLMVQGGFVFGNHSSTLFRIHRASTSTGNQGALHTLRYNCMVWYAVRWLAQYLLDYPMCGLEAIERHGMTAISDQHVVPLVLGLGSFDSSPGLRMAAQRIFEARRDMDTASARFRLARRLGFWTIPVAEKVSQTRCGWRP